MRSSTGLRRGWLILALVAACQHDVGPASPDASPDGDSAIDAAAPSVDPLPSYDSLGPAFKSGTRLRALWQQVGDAAAFFAWYDTQLQLRCTFRLAEDNNWRCLPLAVAQGNVYFADARCEKPLLHPPCDALGPVRTYPFSDYCDTAEPRAVVSIVGGQHGGNVFYRQGMACTDLMWNLPPYRLYAADHVEPATYVKALRKAVRIGFRLHGFVLDGEDGSHQGLWQGTGQLADPRRNAPCKVLEEYWRVEPPVCAPLATDLVSQRDYSDASCTTLVAAHPCDGASSVAVPDDETACRRSLYEVGTDEFVPEVHVRSDGQCIKAQASQSHYTRPSRALGPGELPEVVTAPAPATGAYARLELRTSDGGTLRHTGRFLDLASGRACDVQSTQAGLRCVPVERVEVESLHFYADAACTHPILVTEVCMAPRVAVVLGARGCGPIQELRRVGQRLPLPKFYVQSDTPIGTECAPVPLAGRAGYEVEAAPLDPRTLPEVTERVE